MAKVAGTCAALWIFIGLNLNIGNVDRLPFEHDTSSNKPTDYWQRTALGYRSVVGDDMEKAAVDLEDRRVIGVAQASRIRRNLIAHAPQVGWRTGERRQDPRCGGLLLPTLCERAPGLGEFFGQLLDPAFRRGKIVGGRSCHGYTRFPYNLPDGFGLPFGAG